MPRRYARVTAVSGPRDDSERAPDYLTSAELARVLNVSPRTVQNWAARGTVRPAFRLPSGQLRWSLPDTLRQLREHPAEGDEREP